MSPAFDPTLVELLQEMVEARRSIQQVLKFSPEDVQLHRIHGMYAGQILDIRKALVQEHSADPERLLLDALHTIVRYLVEGGEETAAQFIGERLEDIGNKVKENWQDSKPSPNWLPDTKRSAGISPAASPRSDPPPPPNRPNGGNGPLTDSASSPKPTSPTT